MGGWGGGGGGGGGGGAGGAPRPERSENRRRPEQECINKEIGKKDLRDFERNGGDEEGG